MGKFRMSFGAASCFNYRARSEAEKIVCEQMIFRLEQIGRLSKEQLWSFPNEAVEYFDADGTKCSLVIYREELQSQTLLIVVQVFLPTWVAPNFFSFGQVGKIFADGVVVKPNDERAPAPSDYLLAYR